MVVSAVLAEGIDIPHELTLTSTPETPRKGLCWCRIQRYQR